VIRSFKNSDTEKVWNREHVRAFGPELQRTAQKKLRLLNAASELNSLRVPPGNRLEKLVGDRAGQHSIRINDQYRICFVWPQRRRRRRDHRLPLTNMERRPIMAKAHDPITPGEILLTEFLEPLGITQYRLAQATGLPQTRISEIVRGKRAITTDTALRLSRALGVDDRFWINIQTDYDLEVERDLHADELAKVTALVAS
jgi:antitoxin HigA-1